MLVQKSQFPEISKMEKFAWTWPFLRASYIFPALPGAARCALASLEVDVACGDDSFFVSRNRTSNIFFNAGGSTRNFGRKENPRHGDMFWVIAPVSVGGFG